jgi:hypothetical protein
MDENYWNIFCLISKYFNYKLNLSFIHPKEKYEQYWLKKYNESSANGRKPELVRNEELARKIADIIEKETKIE